MGSKKLTIGIALATVLVATIIGIARLGFGPTWTDLPIEVRRPGP